MKIKTILVNPISDKESPFTFFNRIIERKIIKKLETKKLFVKGRYYE